MTDTIRREKGRLQKYCYHYDFNAGAQRSWTEESCFITERSAKEDHERMKSHVMEEVKQIFKPEFINRVDGIMVFHTLEKPEQRKIVELLLKELSDQTFKNPGSLKIL